MTITLGPETERWVAKHMKQHGYRSAAEVIQTALMLLETSEPRLDETTLGKLLEDGRASLAAGEGIPADAEFATLLAQRRKAKDGHVDQAVFSASGDD